eukprot:TRINITY_DN3035_c0_g1_i1.p1 TRINITY_DN3035_c0_g1~~TRINITY_DN3035_c0_g1_i1.p1  ORF type:complete len:291 (-),score=45.81 TRINITY_DN3035_c0_g1_i1:8-880(-)
MTEQKVQFAASQSSTLGNSAVQAPAGVQHLTIPKKWKHSGLPGSISATRVHYPGLRSEVFGLSDQYLTEEKLQSRDVTRSFKRVAKLGHKPEWNASVQPPNTKFPERPLMRTISEHQGIKLPYNFRAETLPTTYKDTVFVPSASKFQFDKSLLLSPKDRESLSRTNVSVNTRVDPPVHPALQDKERWNISTQVHSDPAHPFLPPVPDRRTLTKAVNESLLSENYIGPRKREKLRSKNMRAEKQAERQAQAEEAKKWPDFSFTLSNMSEHHKHSPFAAQLSEIAASRGLAA